tara:strand:+ start:403 stop:963 length:561 start_codon:yes stop_codon:yes gene_type:complete
MFMLTDGGVINQYQLTPLETFSVVVAAMIHDYEHPGRNNAFLVNTCHPIAIRYNDESVLENHHSAAGFEILLRPECNITSGLSKEDFVFFRKTVISLILATDFSKHFSILGRYKSLMEDSHQVDMSLPENRNLLMQIAIKSADISHTTKAQHLHLAWTERVSEEFFVQGDSEKQEGLAVSPGKNNL